MMSARSRSPVARAVAESKATPPASRSTNASSRLSGSTRGDRARSRAMTVSLTSRYRVKRGIRYAPFGHSRLAWAVGIAECTPNRLAS